MSRGGGRVYLPTYPDRRGNRRRSRVFWLEFSFGGQLVRESTGKTERKEAITVLRRRQEEVQRAGTAGHLTFNDLKELLLQNYRLNGRRSIKRAEGALKHLSSFFQNDRALDISSERTVAYTKKRHEDGAAAATTNVELSVLVRMFTLAVRAGKLSSRPYIAKLNAENARKGFFDRAQLDAVMAKLPAELKPVVETAYLTGWRVSSEILTRRIEHADLRTGCLRLEPGETKNGEGRNFPLTGRLRDVIAQQIEQTREIERRTGASIPWLFHRDGKPIRTFRAAWGKACKEAGVAGRIPHDLRRTAVRNLEIAGVPRSAAQRLVGHKTESMYRRYAIVDQVMLVDAAEKLDRLHAAI